MENKAVLETSNAETVAISRAEYEELQELKKQHEWLLEQLRVLKSKQFSAFSEKASEEIYGQLSLLFNEPEVQEKIQIIPAKIILHRDVYVTYACQNCKENSISTPILQTPKEPALIPGSYASATEINFCKTVTV